MQSHRSALAASLRLHVSTCNKIREFFSSSGRLGGALFVFVWLVYMAFPTRNHYWDGIGFALNIEGVAQTDLGLLLSHQHPDGRHIYFNPNHLLHNLFGFLLYRPVHLLFPPVRALDVLVAVNNLLGAWTVLLLFGLLHRWSGDRRFSVYLSLLFAFAGTWWKFATDANAYIPSVFFLVASAGLLTRPDRRPPLLAVGLLHAMAILVHQIAVLYYPAVLVAIWTHPYWRGAKDWRGAKGRPAAVARYTLASGGPVLSAYLFVWFGVYEASGGVADFLAWLTYNGGDVYAYRGVLGSIGTSFASVLRVFFGGRISLAWRVVPVPLLAGLVTVMCGALVLLFRRRSGPPAPEAAPSTNPWAPFFAAWATVFQLFLFYWLTEYPYYRLFCLPSLILCLAAALRTRPHWRDRLPACVVFLASFNFAFMIYPYSLPEATPPVHLAEEAKSIWPARALVLYREATCDNWFMRYFNPHTEWAHVSGEDLEALSQRIADAHDNGHAVWVDTTLLGHLPSNRDTREWLAEHGMISAAWGLSNGRYHIQFARLVPHP